MSIWVKYCGITRHQDALVAAELGVDAIGLVFYSKSPRAVSIETAKAILQDLPDSLSVVGLFVNESAETIHDILSQVPLDILQFHGAETGAFCEQFNKPYLKSIGMRPELDFADIIKDYHAAKAVILDSYDPEKHGGTGKVFDWQLVPHQLSLPIVIAGGLTPDNVAKAMTQLQPFGVDVSGGIEQAKGIKDSDKMRAFMHAVKEAQCEQE